MEELLKWTMERLLSEKDFASKLKEEIIRRQLEFGHLKDSTHKEIQAIVQKNDNLFGQVTSLTKKNEELLKTIKVLQAYGVDCDMISNEINRAYPEAQHISMSLASQVFHIFDTLGKQIETLKESEAELKEQRYNITSVKEQAQRQLSELQENHAQLMEDRDSKEAINKAHLVEIEKLKDELATLKHNTLFQGKTKG